MTPRSPIGFRRYPEGVQRQLDVAAASAWEALVEIHTGHALRFIALMAAQLDFDDALVRYLDEMDVLDPMASAIRSRVLVALEHAMTASEGRPSLSAYGPAVGEATAGGGSRAASESGGGGSGAGAGEADGATDAQRGLRRFRPAVLMKGIQKRVRESDELDQWVALAVARAEEGVIRAHVDNAALFAALLREHAALADAVDDYLEAMRVSGGRAQSVHQRAMARLAELHLPGGGAGARADESGPTG